MKGLIIVLLFLASIGSFSQGEVQSQEEKEVVTILQKGEDISFENFNRYKVCTVDRIPKVSRGGLWEEEEALGEDIFVLEFGCDGKSIHLLSNRKQALLSYVQLQLIEKGYIFNKDLSTQRVGFYLLEP